MAGNTTGQNPQTKFCHPVPRHTEINEMLAKSILKKLGAR
jgi:hypothetical protein